MKKSKQNKINCEICGIRTCRLGKEKRIFMAKFPLNADRCKQWVKVTGKEDLVNIPIEKLHQLKYVCGSHFKPRDFSKKKTQLRKKAVPSLGITAEPLKDELLVGFPLHISKVEFLKQGLWLDPKVPVGSNIAPSAPNEQTVCVNISQTSLCSSNPLPEPAPPKFSWQKINLISVDEDYTGNENFTKDHLEEADWNESNKTSAVRGELNGDVRTAVTDYRCNGCKQYITGYTCVQCDEYDLCAACEEKLTHPQHYMLRVPGPRPQREVKLIIDVVRRKLEILEAELRNDDITCMSCDLDIKKEDPFEEVPTDAVLHDMEDTILDASAHYEVPDVSNQLHTVDETEIPSVLYLLNSAESGSFIVHNNLYYKARRESVASVNEEVINMPSGHLTSKTVLSPSNQDIRIHPVKRKTAICTNEDFLDDLRPSPELSKITATSGMTRKTSYKQLPHNNHEVPVHPAKRKINDCLDEHFLKDLEASSELSDISATYEIIEKNCTNEDILYDVRSSKSETTASSETIKKINNIELSHSNNETSVHTVKRKPSDCLEEYFFKDTVSPGLSKVTAPAKTIAKPIKVNIITSVTQLSHSNNEIPVHPAKRKTSDCLDEDFLKDITLSPGLSKITAPTKTIAKPIKVNIIKSVTGKRVKLHGYDTRQVKESIIVQDVDDLQTAIPHR